MNINCVYFGLQKYGKVKNIREPITRWDMINLLHIIHYYIYLGKIIAYNIFIQFLLVDW